VTCDTAQALISASFDGEPGPDPSDHIAGCHRCAAFAATARDVRRQLRFESVERPVDVVAAVTDAVIRTRRPSEARRGLVAACFGIGALLSATAVWLSDRPAPTAFASEIEQQVQEAQTTVDALDATVSVVERGWHPAVPERRFSGSLRYRAPETLWLALEDITDYPSAHWNRRSVEVVVDDDIAWQRGPVRCPTESQPECGSTVSVSAVTGREPFPDDAPAALDLIVPVSSFRWSESEHRLGERVIDGRAAIGVEVAAAQVAPMLDLLYEASDLRQVHPTDLAEIWLDQETMVPLVLSFSPAESEARRLWSLRQGLEDAEDRPYLELRIDHLVFDPSPIEIPPIPPRAKMEDHGFRAADGVVGPEPSFVPDGMRLHESGNAGGVTESSWSDGRAWFKVASTTAWRGRRLFGDMGDPVRRVATDSGWVYLTEDGSKAAIHGDDIDLVVTGSLPSETLRMVAESLGISGRMVPRGWVEASTSTIDEASLATDFLLVPSGLQGFGPPSVRIDESTVVLGYAGAGDRGFRITETPRSSLVPPLDADVIGVEVRGLPGRFTPNRGELEWVEAGHVITLRSTTLSLEELLAVATAMQSR
jgi:hypothetical protein